MNRMLFKYFSLVVLGSALGISGCSGTLNVAGELGVREKTDITDIATFELYPGQPENKGVKTFSHRDLGFEKVAAGSSTNHAYSWERIVTPPGQVWIQLLGGIPRVFPASVSFSAEAGGHYYMAITCPESLRRPCAVVIDVDTDKIIATSEHTDCPPLIGTELSLYNECSYKRLRHGIRPNSMAP